LKLINCLSPWGWSAFHERELSKLRLGGKIKNYKIIFMVTIV